MILMKKFTSKEVLEVVGAAVAKTVPENLEGNLSLSYDDDGNVEVYFIEEKTNTETVESQPN